MRWPAVARTTHKWLALVVAIQAVFWTLSGIYMTAVHIDIIHGDRLVRAAAAQPLSFAGLVEPAHLAHLAPGLKSARLETQLGQPVYVVEAEGGKALFDARTGAKLSPLSEAQARARAQTLFAEAGKVVSAELLTKAPLEARPDPCRFGAWSSRAPCARPSTSRPSPASWCRGGTTCGAPSTSSGCSTSWTTTTVRT